MSAFFQSSGFIVATVVLLGTPNMTVALSVSDVVHLSQQKYTDQDIISLISATRSAFELQADDIPRLINKQVSEPVIQAMIKATPAAANRQLVNQSPDTLHAAGGSGNHSEKHGENKSHAPVAPQRTAVKSIPLASRQMTISSEPLHEEAAGSHRHRVVTLAGLQVLTIRDEGQHPDIPTRTRAVVDRLKDVASRSEGNFQSVHIAGRDAVVFNGIAPLNSTVIVTVTQHDALAYQKRSGRSVHPQLLAAYWSDLLTDYWTLAAHRQAPLRLADLHEGEALQMLAGHLQTSANNDIAWLGTATDSLPKQERDHLLRLARTIPIDYAASRHKVERLP